MTLAVLDTSAMIRFYIPDGPLPQDLENYIDAAWKAEATIMTPELALAEFTQVLWKKEQAGYITPDELNHILSAFLELPLKIAGHYDLLPEALIIARRHQLTVYDALFLALAAKKEAILITADQRLAKAFGSLN
jgi:predicted nucleic acid-binding protein